MYKKKLKTVCNQSASNRHHSFLKIEPANSFNLPFFNSIFGLKKSFSKKVFVELKWETIIAPVYRPIVRLIGNNFCGIKFPIESWQQFQLTFKDIEKLFYEDLQDNLIDAKLSGDRWTIRFTRSHTKTSFEIEDVQFTGAAKKFKRSLVLAKVSFNYLNNYLCKCVDLKQKSLKTINRSISIVSKAILEYVFQDIVNANDAHVMIIDQKSIMNFIDLPEKLTSMLEFLKPTDEKVLNLIKNQNVLTSNEKEILFYQIFSTL